MIFALKNTMQIYSVFLALLGYGRKSHKTRSLLRRLFLDSCYKLVQNQLIINMRLEITGACYVKYTVRAGFS